MEEGKAAPVRIEAVLEVAPGADGWTVTPGVQDDAPIVTSNVHDFISWGTKRADWRDSVTGDIARPDVAAVLDAINII